MKFFKMMLPFVVVLGDYFTKTGRMGYDVNSNTVKYKTPSGVKEIATSDQLGGYFVGQLVESLSPTVPILFLELNGQEVSKTTYAALYAFLGDRGTPSDPENFKLPDCTGKVTIGAGAGFTLNSEGGSKLIDLNNLPEIAPKLRVNNVAGGEITPKYLGKSSVGNATAGYVYSNTYDTELEDIIAPFGNENPEPFLPPYIVVKKLIYAGV